MFSQFLEDDDIKKSRRSVIVSATSVIFATQLETSGSLKIIGLEVGVSGEQILQGLWLLCALYFLIFLLRYSVSISATWNKFSTELIESHIESSKQRTHQIESEILNCEFDGKEVDPWWEAHYMRERWLRKLQIGLIFPALISNVISRVALEELLPIALGASAVFFPNSAAEFLLSLANNFSNR